MTSLPFLHLPSPLLFSLMWILMVLVRSYRPTLPALLHPYLFSLAPLCILFRFLLPYPFSSSYLPSQFPQFSTGTSLSPSLTIEEARSYRPTSGTPTFSPPDCCIPPLPPSPLWVDNLCLSVRSYRPTVSICPPWLHCHIFSLPLVLGANSAASRHCMTAGPMG